MPNIEVPTQPDIHSVTEAKRFQHFCNCGPHFHCGNPIVQYTCHLCGTEYIGPDCEVTRPLPVQKVESGELICLQCQKLK